MVTGEGLFHLWYLDSRLQAQDPPLPCSLKQGLYWGPPISPLHIEHSAWMASKVLCIPCHSASVEAVVTLAWQSSLLVKMQIVCDSR